MLSLLLASFVTFFVAIDPVAMAPMFTTMTARMTPEWRRRMAWKSVTIATGILLAFAFGGAWLLERIHVSMDAFRIAGGILLFLIAVDMLFEKRSERRDERAEKVAAHQAEHPEHQDDISVFPLAIPLIAGPGAIASIMLFFAQYEGIVERSMVLLGVGVNLALCLIAFIAAGPLSKIMGPTVASMLTRVFGILLAALAAQFVVDGIRNAFGIP
ncbi:MAG: MarC family protein [Phycisphaerales bacterium]|nr:MarC family protein [Hyphomonadaceae bacterium]